MADEPKTDQQPEEEKPPESQQPPQTGPDGTAAGVISMTRENYDKALKEAADRAAKAMREGDDYKQLRLRAKRADELEGTTRTDADRAAEQIASANAQRDQAVEKAERALKLAHFTAVASQVGIPGDRVHDAFTLADKSVMKVNLDTGTVEGADTAIDALVKARPWLVGPGVAPLHTQQPRPAPNLNAGHGGVPATPEARIQAAQEQLATWVKI